MTITCAIFSSGTESISYELFLLVRSSSSLPQKVSLLFLFYNIHYKGQSYFPSIRCLTRNCACSRLIEKEFQLAWFSVRLQPFTQVRSQIDLPANGYNKNCDGKQGASFSTALYEKPGGLTRKWER